MKGSLGIMGGYGLIQLRSREESISSRRNEVRLLGELHG